MKGFLKVFLIIIVVSVIVIFVTGGICCATYNYISSEVKEQLKEGDAQTIEQRANDIASYSLPEGYSLMKAFDLFGAKAAVFMYSPDQQVLIMAQPPGWIVKINEDNFRQALSPEEIEKAIHQSKHKNVRLKDLKIIKEGTLPTATREIPYVQAEVTLEDRTKGDEMKYEGIFAVMTFSNKKKNVIVLSLNTPGNFNIDAAKDFIKTIQVN
jgi:hypothetical protein